MVSAKSCPCGNERWVMLLGPDHAHAGLCMPGDCPLRNTLRPSNLCVPIALCTDAQQDEVPSSRTQASQETADQLASPPSLNATQWSMPSYSPISAGTSLADKLHVVVEQAAQSLDITCTDTPPATCSSIVFRACVVYVFPIGGVK